MQYGDADLAVLVDVGMPHGRGERHGGRHVGEIGGKDETGFEESAFVEGGVWSHDEDFPVVYVGVVGESDRDEIDGILGQFWFEWTRKKFWLGTRV